MITESAIKSALKSADEKSLTIELRDGGARGEGRLALIARPTRAGNRVIAEWYAIWYPAGRRRMAKIGNHPTIPLADARKAFRSDYLPLIAAGQSPLGPRARRERRGVTFGDMCDVYVEHLEAAGKASAAEVKRILTGVAKRVGRERRAADVKAKELSDVFGTIYRRGAKVMAATTRSYTSSAFAHAMKSANSYTGGAGKVDWGITVNPVDAIPVDTDAAQVGERHLSPEEFKAFWLWLDGKFESAAAAPALQLVMTCGQRVMEIVSLGRTGDYVDGMFDWLKTKNGRPHTIPAPAQARAIMARLTKNPQGLYFPRRGVPRMVMRKDAPAALVRQYVREVKCEPFTPRDLRRTWKTLAGAAGLSKDIRDRLQNHARTDVASRHYDRYEYLPEKREAMDRWEAYLASLLA